MLAHGSQGIKEVQSIAVVEKFDKLIRAGHRTDRKLLGLTVQDVNSAQGAMVI
jgi:hypothetical protein